MRRRRYQDASRRFAVSRGGIGNGPSNAPRVPISNWSDPTGVKCPSESLRYRDTGGVHSTAVSRADCSHIGTHPPYIAPAPRCTRHYHELHLSQRVWT